MQDERNTSLLQEINITSFNDGLCSSDITGRPVAILHAAAAQDDSRVCHEAGTLNVDDEVLRKRMENPLLFMTRIMNR